MLWSRIVSKFTIAIALIGSAGFLMSTSAQSPDPSVGRHLAETVCSACHQIDAYSQGLGPNPDAPNFVDISRMPSMSELAIKVFLRSPHPSMPNIILSAKEIDSVAAYIRSLNIK
jgi:mono/diheme cytochrome c family protein